MLKEKDNSIYQSPKVKVIDVCAQSIICASDLTVDNPFGSNEEEEW